MLLVAHTKLATQVSRVLLFFLPSAPHLIRCTLQAILCFFLALLAFYCLCLLMLILHIYIIIAFHMLQLCLLSIINERCDNLRLKFNIGAWLAWVFIKLISVDFCR